MLTGVGSRAAGVRWRAPRNFRTVYASLVPPTLLEDVLARLRRYGLRTESAMPRVTVAACRKLSRALDLRAEIHRVNLPKAERKPGTPG